MSSVCLMLYMADWVLVGVDFSGLASSNQPHAAWQRENELKNNVYTLLVDNTIPFVSLQTTVCKSAELGWSVWHPDNQGTIALVMSASLSPITHSSNMHIDTCIPLRIILLSCYSKLASLDPISSRNGGTCHIASKNGKAITHQDG